MAQEWEQRSEGRRGRKLAMPLTLVALGLIAGFVAMPGSAPDPDRSFSVVVDDSPVPAPSEPADTTPTGAASGRWRGVSPGRLPPRTGAVVVEGAGSIFVWGGQEVSSGLSFGDGATYVPRDDVWLRVSAAPIQPRLGAASAWTGREFVVWGGVRDDGELMADGAAYDPATRRWRRLAPAPMDPRQQARAVWTGGKVVVWGGRRTGRTRFADGATYDPATDRWRRLPPGPLSNRRDYDVSTVALDGGMFVWSSSERSAATAFYDVATREWRTLQTPRFRPGSGPAFTNLAGAVFAWGESTIGDKGPLALMFTTEPDWWVTAARPPVLPGPPDGLVSGGGIAASPASGVLFDVFTNRWERMGAVPPAASPETPAVAQVGPAVFVWHGYAQPDDPNRAAVWRPSRLWRDVPGAPVELSGDVTASWTGWLRDQQQVLVFDDLGWGGTPGGAYTPATERWDMIPPPPPPRRIDPAVAWSGRELLVYGGTPVRSQGARHAGVAFDPDRGTWRRLPPSPFPVAARAAAWGDVALFSVADVGGSAVVTTFDPAADSWDRVPAPPLARGRGELSLVWTGFEAWVWRTQADGTARGAAWDPMRRMWRQLAPAPRLFSRGTFVQAGRRMFVFDRHGATASLGWGTGEWRRHPRAPFGGRTPLLTWTGRRIVAYLPQSGRMVSLDPRADAWVEHPRPSPGSDPNAALLFTGRQLFVVGTNGIKVLGEPD